MKGANRLLTKNLLIMKKTKKAENTLAFDESKTSSRKTIAAMAQKIDELKAENRLVCETAAKTILKSLDLKDNYTFNHSLRVCHYCLVLTQELNLTEEQEYHLQLTALFHDIGKIGTPDAVLNKPTRLSDIEFKIMQRHPVKSYEILKDFKAFEEVAKAVKHHHERYDGRGYPDNLKGEEIPLLARAVLIADTYDAMTSVRVYRKGLPPEVAFNELIEFSGSQFDPGLVKKFIVAMRREQQKDLDSFYIPLIDETIKKDNDAA